MARMSLLIIDDQNLILIFVSNLNFGFAKTPQAFEEAAREAPPEARFRFQQSFFKKRIL